MAVFTLSLLTNWTVFLNAMQSGHVVSAALGYFIYSICSVMLGIVVLGERLDHWTWLALGYVACRVLAKSVLVADVPWIAMLVAGSFALYAVTRERLNIGLILGLFVETLLLLPVTIRFFGWLPCSGQSLFFVGGALFVVLVLFVGVLTVVPLILAYAGNRLLNMTMSSLLFYSNPTTQLLFAIWLLGEAIRCRTCWLSGQLG